MHSLATSLLSYKTFIALQLQSSSCLALKVYLYQKPGIRKSLILLWLLSINLLEYTLCCIEMFTLKIIFHCKIMSHRNDKFQLCSYISGHKNSFISTNQLQNDIFQNISFHSSVLSNINLF